MGGLRPGEARVNSKAINPAPEQVWTTERAMGHQSMDKEDREGTGGELRRSESLSRELVPGRPPFLRSASSHLHVPYYMA